MTTTCASTTPGKPRRLASAALIGVGLAIALAGCGGGSGGGTKVASLGSSDASPTAGASSASGTKPSALAYSQCMRSHGIKDFPDPDADGDIALEAGPGSDLDPQNQTFKSADAACKPLLPNRGKAPAGLKKASTKYSQCMRDHGVKDFPDPHADGTLQIQAGPNSDLSPDNPTFKAANEACQHYMPGGGGGMKLNVHKG